MSDIRPTQAPAVNPNQGLIDSARSEISSAEGSITQEQLEIDKLEGKIDRLKAAKDIVKGQKSEVSSGKSLAKKHDDVSEWKGTNYNNYKITADALVSSYTSYEDGVDTVQDEINNEITRLENQIYEAEGVIGWLKSKINSLINSIGNWLN